MPLMCFVKIIFLSILLFGCGGKHYDCKNIPDDLWPDEGVEAYDYCVSDRMYDRCNFAKYGHNACNWKK